MDATEISQNSAQLRVIGHNLMHNQLLVSFLEKETGLSCRQNLRLELPITEDVDEESTVLFLLDSKSQNLDDVWRSLEDRLIPRKPTLIFAIYNLDRGIDIGIEAVDHGIRGIFYDSDSLEFMPKGIQAILDGEMWYPRSVLSLCIMTYKKRGHIPDNGSAVLTKRERDILLKVFSGDSNQEIAEVFCISYHTVKTHLYNIYRKIGVRDRYRATQWAAKHL